MAEQALAQALLLARSPGLARRFRMAPLPDGMLHVLRIAAGDAGSISEARASTERSVKSLQEAAAFYIVQILLSPGQDSYRTLGANAGASRDELRSHMVWLLKWLHPDTHKGEQQTVFATRVTQAWESLRTDETRSLYDATQKQANKPSTAARPSRQKSAAFRPDIAALPRFHHGHRTPRWRRWAVPVLLGSLVTSGIALGAVYFATILHGGPEARPRNQLESEAGFRR